MKVEVPKWSKWERADGFRTPAGNSVTCEMASTRAHPGSQAQSSLNGEGAVTMEIRVTARAIAHPPTSLASEDEGSVTRKSEAPIVAMNSGNSEGAKGCRREITDQGNMARH